MINKLTLSLHRIAQRVSSTHKVLVAIVFVILGTLFYMQIWQNDFFFKRGTKNFLRHERVVSLRGAILDCNGKPLATNRGVTSLVWHGTGNKVWSDEQQTILTKLEIITGVPTLAATSDLVFNERMSRDYLLLYDIPFDQLSKILEQIPSCSNIIITTSYARLYPHHMLACHLLGYFREQDSKGIQTGMEQLFEEQLRGIPGILERTIDSVGRSLQLREVQKALNGQNVLTTIDLDLQRIAEKVFPEGEKGACIVMDPHNGAVRVCMSRPAFDPNIFLKSIAPEEWAKLQTEKPFIDRCMACCYPPASLFKLITTTAGLEEGIINPDKSWFCNGQIEFGGRPYLCNRHKYGGHGAINSIEEALAYSCNIPFFEIGKRITIDTLSGYAKKFGLGQKTNIILPEKTGLIPTTAWKRRVYGEPWWQGETLNCAIGQGPFLVTPLQMARMFGGICSGVLVRPRILEGESIDLQPLQISSHTLKFLRKAIRMTVTLGTGSILNPLKNITIYAKTGTAQTSHRSKRDLGKEFLEHAWFASFAQYKDHEPVVLVVFLENAGSASFATRVAKRFFIEYCQLMDERESNPDTD